MSTNDSPVIEHVKANPKGYASIGVLLTLVLGLLGYIWTGHVQASDEQFDSLKTTTHQLKIDQITESAKNSERGKSLNRQMQAVLKALNVEYHEPPPKEAEVIYFAVPINSKAEPIFRSDTIFMPRVDSTLTARDIE